MNADNKSLSSKNAYHNNQSHETPIVVDTTSKYSVKPHATSVNQTFRHYKFKQHISHIQLTRVKRTTCILQKLNHYTTHLYQRNHSVNKINRHQQPTIKLHLYGVTHTSPSTPPKYLRKQSIIAPSQYK
eukprot:gene2880-1862_t